MDNNKVVWCWSLDDPNVLFIFRVGGKELKVDITKLGHQAKVYNSVFFFKKEVELLIDLLQELKRIK